MTRYLFVPAIGTAVVSAVASSTFASVANYSGTYTVASFAVAGQPEIQPGDVFHYSFTIDTNSLATGVSGNSTNFNNAITSFSLTRDTGNAGSWDPSSGTFVLSPIDTFFANNSSEFVSIIAGGTGFPDASGSSFDSFQLSLPLAGIQDIQPGTTGDPLSQVFGGTPQFQDIASPSGTLRLGGGSVTLLGDVTIIPAPASAALLSFGGLALIRRRRNV